MAILYTGLSFRISQGQAETGARRCGRPTQERADMTIRDMLHEEHTNTQSMDELYVRNIARVGSRY
jgi:hypothetical protein